MRALRILFFSGCTIFLFTTLSLSNDQVKTSHLRTTQLAGAQLFQLKNCTQCHTSGEKGDGKLTAVNEIREDAWFKEHVKKESKIVLREAKSSRKQRRVLKEEIVALTDFLFKSSAEEKKQISAQPASVVQGAFLVYQNGCLKCHSISGFGKEVGPDLTYIADKHNDRAWHVQNLKDPQQFHPESPMPKFDKLPEEQLNAIIDYLLTLKK